MICYIMCILLWIAYLWLDCMVVAYAFEPRRDSVRQAGIILGPDGSTVAGQLH